MPSPMTSAKALNRLVRFSLYRAERAGAPPEPITRVGATSFSSFSRNTNRSWSVRVVALAACCNRLRPCSFSCFVTWVKERTARAVMGRRAQRMKRKKMRYPTLLRRNVVSTFIIFQPRQCSEDSPTKPPLYARTMSSRLSLYVRDGLLCPFFPTLYRSKSVFIGL